MRFWDASAVVPRLVDEPIRPRRVELLRQDAAMLVWWATPVECASAIARRERDGSMAPADATRSLDRLRRMSTAWNEVLPAAARRDEAMRLLRVHPLRSADALQLAAALAGADGEPSALEFVCLDARLADAAAREGLRVLAS
jgi:predicted nucleic acid-binding protein